MQLCNLYFSQYWGLYGYAAGVGLLYISCSQCGGFIWLYLKGRQTHRHAVPQAVCIDVYLTIPIYLGDRQIEYWRIQTLSVPFRN